ncbi:MAG: radical SAM family heme chaperone HemW [Oscillospiraceae bacterium]|nr:radical SAM family heme chaperone HemW [Oscillospiraceae bacterium]
MTGIYIHVPFCAQKCPYCDFYSCNYSLKKAEEYKNAVLRNISALQHIKADTVYFGGGTPSILPAEYIDEILSVLSKKHELAAPEITMELNPSTVTEEKLKAYHKAGVNRLSFGVQSGLDDELAFLGRRHTFEKAANAVRLAHSLGFENVSCDLMIGVKGQDMARLEESVERLSQLPVKHISSYILKIEENTPFGLNNIVEVLPDDDEVAELYLHSVKCLEERGFMQYEISNFSKDGFESRHNLKYWNCEEYIGIGPAAHSYFEGKRFSVSPDLLAFCESDVQERVYEDYIPGTDEEKIMLGLRLKKGIAFADYPSLSDKLETKARKYASYGMGTIENGRFSLTPSGFLVSNSIIADMTT